MKRIKTAFLFLLCGLLLLTVNVHASKLEEGKELFFKGRESFYNNEEDISSSLTLLKQSKQQFANLNNEFNKYYWQAQSEFVIAEIYETKKEKKKALLSFNNSEQLVKKALKEKKTSEGLRLLADTYMRQINYKGIFYSMTYGPKAMELLEKSIQLNNKNYTAYNSLGTYYINAPKIGGGDINKAIKALTTALNSNNQFDNFISYHWLSIAYNKQDKEGKALKYVNKALEIYPNSLWAKNTLQQIKQD
ncbi:hypothetical protein JCM16358_14720 [Halanaerocella petrolearia]